MTSERRADGKVVISFHIRPALKEQMKRIAAGMDRETLSDVVESIVLAALTKDPEKADATVRGFVILKRKGAFK